MVTSARSNRALIPLDAKVEICAFLRDMPRQMRCQAHLATIIRGDAQLRTPVRQLKLPDLAMTFRISRISDDGARPATLRRRCPRCVGADAPGLRTGDVWFAALGIMPAVASIRFDCDVVSLSRTRLRLPDRARDANFDAETSIGGSAPTGTAVLASLYARPRSQWPTCACI